MKKKKLVIKEMGDTPISPNKTSTKSLSSLLQPYGITPKWIYYSLNEKGEKDEVCGRKHDWSKNECYNTSVSACEADGKSRWCVREYDIRNTPLAFFDDDKRDRSIEETIQEYPFLKDGYNQEGNTKGYHILMTNPEFINAKKVLDHINKRDLITDTIWCKSDKLYGDKIISVDIMDVKIQFPKFQTGIEQVEKVVKQKTNDDVGEVIIKESKKDEFLEELLDNIKLEYCENFQSWFDIVRALKGTNNSNYIDYFSKRCSSKYKDEKYDSTINSSKGNNYSIGTLYHYSRLSDSRKHFDILDKYDKIPIKPYDELGDIDYANIFIAITDDVFYHSTRECYYGYNSTNYTWEEKKKEYMLEITSNNLLDYLNKELRKIYFKMSKLKVCTNVDKTCNCSTCSTKATYSKQIKQIEKNIKCCKSTPNTRHVIDYIFDILRNKGVDIQMDANPYLFCWNNKTYDIDNGKFVKRNKYDYITTTTGYDYEEPSIDYKGEINSLMTNIFSDVEVGKCFFSICRSGLTAVLEEKFTLANGSGGNGKGLINFGMKMLGGKYYHEVSHAVITKEITGDKALPELSQLNGVRYCVISEINENRLILEDSIKKSTNGVINARGLYSSNTKMRNTATWVAECNARPKIQGENGDAIGRRFLDVYFNKKYTNDPIKLKKPGYLQANSTYKTEDYWLPRRIAFFFWLLDYTKEHTTIYEPDVVKERSREYLRSCNVPQSVLDEYYEKVEYDKTKNTCISATAFLKVFRRSDDYKNLDKQEKTLYKKDKIIEFFKKNDCYSESTILKNKTPVKNCLVGYKFIGYEVDDEEEL